MSEQDVELARAALQAYNAWDVEAFIALCDPQIEVRSAFAAVGGGIYNGHDGLRRLFGDIEDVWGDGFRLEPEAYFDLGEHTLVFYVARGRGRQSGADVAVRGAGVTTGRDGLIVSFKGYTHREDALRDLGVSEDALEPIDP